MTDTPRKGKPSASSALQDSLCAGRWRAQAEAGDGEEAEAWDTKDAEVGRRIHELYAGKPAPGATAAETDRADLAREIDQKILERWLSLPAVKAMETQEPLLELREERFWLLWEDGSPRYSGQADIVYVKRVKDGPAHILVGDLKGLWGDHDESSINMQLRMYIALVGEHLTREMGVTTILSATTYLNQPAVTRNPAMTVYEPADIVEASCSMLFMLEGMEAENAPRVAGPVQCRLCKAKPTCPEYQAQVTDMVAPPSPGYPQGAVRLNLKSMTGSRLAELIPWADSLHALADWLESEAKRRLRIDPTSVPGYILKSNPDRRQVTDIERLWIKLQGFGVSWQEFLSICKVSGGDVGDIIKEKTKQKGNALKATVNAVIDDVSERQKIAPSLKPNLALMPPPEEGQDELPM